MKAPMDETLTLDGFLDGRVQAQQLQRGLRAGHDAVFLAAAVPVIANDWALELGAGSGVVSLCVGARVPACRVTGIDVDHGLVGLANANAARNGMEQRVQFTKRSVESLEDHLHGESGPYDHVFFNPPFHPASGQRSQLARTDRAKRDLYNAVAVWTSLALRLARVGGSVTAILRADREGDMLRAAGPVATTVLPLVPHEGEAAKRVLIQLRKGIAAPPVRLPAFVLHRPDGMPTPEADAVLRGRSALPLAETGVA